MRSTSPERGHVYRVIPALALSILLVVAACSVEGSESGGTAAPPAPTTTAADGASSAPTPAAGEDAAPAPTSEVEPVECLASVTGIPQTGVALPIPDEFYVAEAFSGIFHDASGASIFVVELPERLSEEISTTDFLEALETEQGVNITERHDEEIAGHPATLVRAWQTLQGTRLERWLVIAESDDSTLMLTAQVPASEPPGALDALRDVLLCAAWTPGEMHGFADGPPFTIQPVPPFDDEQPLAGGTSFDGGDGALFIVVPSIAPLPGGRREVALDLFASMGPRGGGSLDAEPAVTAGPEPVSIDGFDGIRLDGEGSIEGEPFTIFQVVLFGEDDAYWRLVALIPTDRAEDLLPAAEEMARSFRRH